MKWSFILDLPPDSYRDYPELVYFYISYFYFLLFTQYSSSLHHLITSFDKIGQFLAFQQAF